MGKPAKQPWNHWYHCMTNTYGTWLRGDPRGWRARHHREHVDGDYQHPPPRGKFDRLHAQSRRLMTRDPVHLEPNLRQIVLRAIVEKLQSKNVDVIVGSLDDHHLHVLARFPDQDPRIVFGIAKKHAAFVVKQMFPDFSPGGIWAKRSKNLPITDRAHQLSVVRYILRHQRKGAAIWAIPAIRAQQE